MRPNRRAGRLGWLLVQIAGVLLLTVLVGVIGGPLAVLIPFAWAILRCRRIRSFGPSWGPHLPVLKQSERMVSIEERKGHPAWRVRQEQWHRITGHPVYNHAAYQEAVRFYGP